MRLPDAGPIEGWVLRHQGVFIVVLSLIVAGLVPLSIWLLFDEVEQRGKLRGVGVAGPCRAYGIQNDECQKQSRRIFAACYIQRDECWDKYGLPREKPIPEREAPKYGGARGGDALQTGSTGHQQPTPSPSGGGGNGTEAGKGGGHGPPASGHGGSGGPSAPANGGSDSAPAPPPGGSGGQQSSVPAAPPANEAATPEPHPLPETAQAAGDVVGKAGEAAEGVVEGTGKAAGCVVRGSC